MLKIGLVGYGFIGGMHSSCYAATGKAQVVAVADVEPDRRASAEAALGCQTYASIEDMLSSADIDIVDICTPTYLHRQHAITAAEAGKHILCEKPMALSTEDCDAMIAAANKAGVSMMVGHVIRFWPEYQVVKDIIDSGKYGKVLWLSARRLSPPATWAWQGWLADPAKSGGAIHDLHIHDQDYIEYLIGSPSKVSSIGIPGPKGGFDSAMTLGFDHSSGANSYAECSLDLAPGFPFTMSLIVAAEKATIKLDSSASPSLMVYPVDGENYAPELPTQDISSSPESAGNISSLGGYFNEINYFVDCIIAGKKPEIVTPESARNAVRIVLAAAKSAKTGNAVDL